MKEPPLLQVQDLTVRYPGGHEAVREVSFAVGTGERVGIVGESGSGKSSLARAILGLVPPASGTLAMRGEAFHGTTRSARVQRARQVQMIFQDPYHSLNPRRTIRQTLVEAIRASGKTTTPIEAEKAAARLLAKVQLDPSALHRYPHQFSGGQRQRICIARALAPEPDLLVCDEAVSALDVTTQRTITHLLRELSQSGRIALLFITHDLPLIEDLCDQTLVIHGGTLVEQGPTATIFHSPTHPQTRKLLESVLRI